MLMINKGDLIILPPSKGMVRPDCHDKLGWWDQLVIYWNCPLQEKKTKTKPECDSDR